VKPVLRVFIELQSLINKPSKHGLFKTGGLSREVYIILKYFVTF